MILILVALALFAPAVAQAQTVNHQFKLSWTDTSNNEEGFIIYRDKVKVAAVGKDNTSYTDPVTGIPGQQYCYEVSAYNHEYADGTGKIQESPRTNVACDKIPLPLISPPSAPTGLSTSAVSTTMIRLSWAKNSDNEANFQAERRSFQPPGIAVLTMPKDVPNFDDKNLTRNRTYCYRVRAQNITGDSSFSNESCATTNR